MSPLFGRLFSWFANEFIIHNLAKSRNFKLFALKMDSFLSHHKEVAKESASKAHEVIKSQASKLNETTSASTGFNAKTFYEVFMTEIKNGFNSNKSKTSRLK